tara:strand:+ start:1506 stop:3200 length:1695 start_codon:yes stop_codon:yes gene_type:complete
MPSFKIETNKSVKCDEYVLLELDTPIQTLERLTSIVVLGNSANNIVIEYRYSNDGNIWSEWISWPDWNLNPGELTWFGFRVKSDTSWNFTGIDLEWTGGELLGECLCSVIKYSEDSFIVDCGNNNQYEYSNALASVGIWQKMSQSVFNRFGWPVVYFKCDPVEQSRDVVFKEWSLLEVRECKQIKVVVPGNDFGSGDFQFTEFDIDFADELEFQISKESFWTAFGTYEQPAEKDFLYFPLEGRMYRINSAQESKDFMRQSNWWKGTLVKWNESDSIIKDSDIQTTIDELTLNFEDVGFEAEREIEEADIVKDEQYVVRAVNLSDNVRETVNLLWEPNGVKEENLTNYFTVFSKYHYDLTQKDTSYVISGATAVNGATAYGATATELVTYQDTIDVSKNLSLMFWYNGKVRPTNQNNTWRELFKGGQKIELYVSGDFITKLRCAEKTYTINVPLNDWYAYYIGFNRVDNTMTLRIWKRADINSKTTKMSVFFQCIDTIPTTVTGNWKPVLMNSNDRIASIRFLKAPVTLENQSILFTKIVFPDDGNAYIIDDCFPIMYMDQLPTR